MYAAERVENIELKLVVQQLTEVKQSFRSAT